MQKRRWIDVFSGSYTLVFRIFKMATSSSIVIRRFQSFSVLTPQTDHLDLRAMMTRILFLLLFLAHPLSSHATITVNSIRGASNHDLPETGTPSIWGGVAGASTAGTCGTATITETCNSCEDNGDATNDNRLTVCNKRRIHSNLRLVVNITSDTLDGGQPLATLKTTSSEESVTLTGETPTSQSKGSAFEVVMLWSTICTKMGRNADCSANGTDGTSFTLRVGACKTQGCTTLSNSGDEFKEITIKVMQDMGQPSATTSVTGVSTAPTVPNCASNTGVLCYVDLGAGDEKAVVKSIRASPSFPVTGNTTFSAIRLFRVRSTSVATDAATAQANFDRINPISDSDDLAITAEGSGYATDPKRVSLGENSTDASPVEFYFKAALVDQAQNVGYYTSDAEDLNCYTGDDSITTDTRTLGQCHRVEPGEVLGILAEQVNCFIATAAYGSPMAPQVATFRSFRDKFLLPTKLGKNFVRFYYKEAPAYAEKIARNETLRALARGALWPVLGYASLSLKFGPIVATVLSLIALFTLWITVRMSFSVAFSMATQAVRTRYNKKKRS